MYAHVISMLLLTSCVGLTTAWCSAGYFDPDGRGCVPCPRGSFLGYHDRLNECNVCPMNTYTNKPYAATSCVDCPRGTSTRNIGNFHAQQCQCGTGYHWTDQSRTSCVVCDKGNRSCGDPPVPLTTYNKNTSTTPHVSVEPDELGGESQYTQTSNAISLSVIRSCGWNYCNRFVVSLVVVVTITATRCSTQ